MLSHRDGIMARSNEFVCNGIFALLRSKAVVAHIHGRTQKLSRNELKPAGKLGCGCFRAKCEGFDVVSNSDNVGNNEVFPAPESTTLGLGCFVELFLLCNKHAGQKQDGVGPCK